MRPLSNPKNDAYWLTFEAKDHKRLAEFMRAASTEGKAVSVGFTTDTFMSITEVRVHTPDQPGLFSKLAGAIAMSGATILDAKAFTLSDGMALDLFYVQDAIGGPFHEKARLSRLKKAIEDTVTGKVDPTRRLSRPKLRKREQAFVLEPEVFIDNQASDLHTMIEVTGRDRPGLLFDLTRTLADLRLSISSAHISTYGEKAVDVFYVKNRAGFKITNQDAIDKIKDQLHDAMAGPEGNQAAAAE